MYHTKGRRPENVQSARMSQTVETWKNTCVPLSLFEKQKQLVPL